MSEFEPDPHVYSSPERLEEARVVAYKLWGNNLTWTPSEIEEAAIGIVLFDVELQRDSEWERRVANDEVPDIWADEDGDDDW